MTNTANKLEIATKTITIKVIQVDGHKMTKATFDQIPILEKYTDMCTGNDRYHLNDNDLKRCFREWEQYSPNINILGWINSKTDMYTGKWILCEIDSTLSKFFCNNDRFQWFALGKYDQLYIAT